MSLRKLHIGPGKCCLPQAQGWVNIDLFSSTQADYYADMTALPYPRETFEMIYASHVLEHCHRNMVLATLAHWRDLLRPGGTLRLAVPDFAAVSTRYQKTHNLRELIGLLYGGQNHPRNVHTIIFDEIVLKDALTRVGFRIIRHWDWRTSEHAQYDDYSQCFLPHMDKEHGDQLSLNMEATKE